MNITNEQMPAELAKLTDAGQGAVSANASRFNTFVKALEELCKVHGVTLSTSGYDGLQVWDADASGPLHVNGIEDRTGASR